MAQCIALACPRLSNTDPDSRELAVNFPRGLLTHDALGNGWCNFCQKQRELMDYGNEHDWPAVRVQGAQGRYALLNDAADWYASIACGKQDMIDALYNSLIGNE